MRASRKAASFPPPAGRRKAGLAAAYHKDSRRDHGSPSRFRSGFPHDPRRRRPGAADSLSRFLDGLWKSEPPPAAPVAAPPPGPALRLVPRRSPPSRRSRNPAAAQNAALPAAGKPVADAAPKPVAAKPVPQKPVPAAAAPPAAKPLAAKPAPVKPVATAAARPSVPIAKPVPLAPVPQAVAVQHRRRQHPDDAAGRDRAGERLFRRHRPLSASFSQTSPGGRSGGTLALKRPGQLQFAYAPPSTLEIISDGKSVAVRDRKLGTNDVYSVGQTPLKFLLKEDFDLGRDTKVRDVQTSPDGIVTIQFEDSATFGGTSKSAPLRRARERPAAMDDHRSRQGFETTVSLTNVQIVRRQSTSINRGPAPTGLLPLPAPPARPRGAGLPSGSS